MKQFSWLRASFSIPAPKTFCWQAAVPLFCVCLSACSPIAYVGNDATPPKFSPSLTQSFELSAQQPTSVSLSAPLPPDTVADASIRHRAAIAQSNSGLQDLLMSPIRALFDGRGNPNLPPGTRGSASQSWSDDGNGSAPSHWRPIGFQELSGWSQDNHTEALGAFLRSCETINRRGSGAAMGKMSYGGYAGQWQQLCAQAASTGVNPSAARSFFERNFQPYFIPGPGKFTGYYEASLNGSRVRTGAYQWPLYRKPADMTAGQPYFDRAQIDAGVLDGRGLELLWIDNPVDIFLLHIQGSGVVNMPDGNQVRVGYAGNNGHKFKGIKPALEAKGYDTQANGLTIQAYRNWLMANPSVAREVMNYNPRYIFFDFNEAPAAKGDGGTLLTAQRSMAVDKSIIPLHVPLWVTTNVPGPNGQGQVDVARLMIAQDTGTAIKGEIRGDYYWGPGAEAFARAGRMWGTGTYRVLLPKFIPLR